MKTAQSSNVFLCCINPENRIQCRVYSLGVVHQIMFILLIATSALIIKDKDIDPDPPFFIVLLIFSIIGFLLTVLSIIGTALKNKYFIFPWLIFGVLLVILELVNLDNVFTKDEDLWDITEAFGLIVVSVGFWICNFNMYKKITSIQGLYILIDQQNEENPIVSTSNYNSIT